MASSRCPYGPAQEQPPRAWMPNRSLSTRDHEVMVQETLAVPDPERDDGQPGRLAAAEDLDSRAAGPAAQHVLPQLLLTGGDQIGANGLLQRHGQAGPDGLDDCGRAALLAGDRVVEITVADRVHERHGAAAGYRRHPIADQLAAHDQDARRLRPAGELVRRQEDRVLVIISVRPRRADADGHVRPRGCVVPEGQRAVSVQQRSDRAGVGEDAGDVGGGGEAPDQQRPVRVPDQLALQIVQVDVAVGILADDHDVGDRLAPRQLVGVMLVGADEHDRPIIPGDLRGELVPLVQAGRYPQLQDADQLVHRRRSRPSR